MKAVNLGQSIIHVPTNRLLRRAASSGNQGKKMPDISQLCTEAQNIAQLTIFVWRGRL
jgi:hypothetical protein